MVGSFLSIFILLAGFAHPAAAGAGNRSIFDPGYVTNQIEPSDLLAAITAVVIVSVVLEVAFHVLEHRFHNWPHYMRILNKGERVWTEAGSH